MRSFINLTVSKLDTDYFKGSKKSKLPLKKCGAREYLNSRAPSSDVCRELGF
jgi:hypothetical protein